MNLTTFQQIEYIIQKIPQDLVKESQNTFYFNRMYRAYMSKDSKNNIPKAFGVSLFWRIYKYGKKIRKKTDLPLSITLSLPEDSIIFARPEKDGIIALSYEKNVNVKVILNLDFLSMLEYEVRALNALKGFSFAPQIMGSSLKDNFWLVTDCSKNTDPFLRIPKPEKYLLENFKTLILPSMSEFYSKTLSKRETLKDWIDRALIRANTHPNSEMILNFIEKLATLPNTDESEFMVTSLVHFDLHAGNILRDDGNFTIVDWEGGAEGLTMMDFFYMTKRYIKSNKRERKKFMNYVAGDESSLSPYLVAMSEAYSSWLNDKPVISPRVFMMASLIEQVLVLYEDRKFNCFEEPSGFEREVFSQI